MRSKTNRILMLTLLLSFMQCAISNETGTICVAPVGKPNNGGKSLANPSGGNQIHSYSVTIDNRPSVDISAKQNIAIDGLSLNGKHLIQIHGDGKNLTAFRFRFNDYGSHHLCLWFKPLYETWSLTSEGKHNVICSCL